ncbi:MAG TPA: hypothetical protein VGG48_08915, partial [Rhizomicrobium sp.]
MIAARSFANQTVGVYGLARSGGASVRALKAGGANVYAWDDNAELRAQAAKDGATVAPIGEWPRFKALILSPGIPLTHPKPHEVVLAARAIVTTSCGLGCVSGTPGLRISALIVFHG